MKNIFTLSILLLALLSPGLVLMFVQPDNGGEKVLGEATQQDWPGRANPPFTCGLPFLRDDGCPCKTDFVCKSNTCENRRCAGQGDDDQDDTDQDDDQNDSDDSTELKCDFDEDGELTVLDYNILVTDLQTNPDPLRADCNGNGEIDVMDYVLWLQEYSSF